MIVMSALLRVGWEMKNAFITDIRNPRGKRYYSGVVETSLQGRNCHLGVTADNRRES